MANLLFPLLTEQTVNLLIAQIKANFNLQIKNIDNKYADGISIPPLDNEHIYISDQFQGLKSPMVYILFTDHAFQYTKDPNYLDSIDKCLVVVSANDVDADVLTRKIWRYARVLFGTLNLASLSTSDGRLQINCIPQRLGYTQPISDKLNASAKKFRMDAVLELDIKHFEKELF